MADDVDRQPAITQQGKSERLLDVPFERGVVTEVKDGAFGVDSSWLSMPPYALIQPKVGDTVAFYGKGLGFAVRGVDFNGEPSWYETEAEHESRVAEATVVRERKERAEFETKRAEYDAIYAALPSEFQCRIDRFRRGNPDFRWKFESYELSVCVDAVKIAEWARGHQDPGEMVKQFSAMSHKEQNKTVTGLFDGHSGNSFGFAVQLAHIYVTQPGLVEWHHGALTPLVGCDEYGCTPHATEEILARL